MKGTKIRTLSGLALGIAAGWLAAPARAADTEALAFAVQPILGEERTKKAFQPLAEYISEITQKKFVVRTRPNFLTYWKDTYEGNYTLVLDAAHFTDYRIKKLGFTVLAKIPDMVSYSLVVREDELVFEPTELVGKRIATLGPPSVGAARLDAMYPNPARQPVVIEVGSSEEGMQMLLDGKVDAAVLPTPLVGQRMAGEGGIAVVTTTPQIPHIAVSASPRIDPQTQNVIRKALLEAHKSPRGREMLKKIGFPRFDPATPEIYAGQSDILKNTWGY